MNLGYYELMDRAHIILETFVEKIEEHPETQKDEGLKLLAKHITEELMNFYQAAGSRFHKSDPEED